MLYIQLEISRSIMNTHFRNIKKREAATSKEDAKQGLKRLAKLAKPQETTEHPLETEQQKRDENHNARMLELLLNFDVCGFKATNCIFKENIVEIYYILEDSDSTKKEELKQNLASHLQIEAERLKLIKLRAPPVFKETSINPGDRVHRDGNPPSQCSVGAFVNVTGKGIHALMSGHGKNPGDRFIHQNGDLLEVVVSLTFPPPAPAINDDLVYRDIALARLINPEDQVSKENQYSFMTSGNHTLYLTERPGEAADNMAIRLFASGDRVGRIHRANYNKFDHSLNISYRLISVLGQQGQPVHEDGESGMIITTDPVGNRVTAVGMLIALETVWPDDKPTPITYSLAAPLTTGLKALRRDPYCGGEEVTFC